MRAKVLRWCSIVLAGLVVAAAWFAFQGRRPNVEGAVETQRLPRIDPDYAGIVVPPNIAPLNFAVCEDAGRYFVRISGPAAEPIEIVADDAAVAIPERPWHALLDANRGQDLHIDVYAEVDGQWRQFRPIVNRVANENIDSHLAFRVVGPVHNQWGDMAVRQRNLENFEESPLLDGQSLGQGCVNCHSFANNNPQTMLLAVRGRSAVGTLLVENGKPQKLNLRMGYVSWHPNGRIAAYSVNKIEQLFHTAGDQVRDVIDVGGALAYCRLDAAKVQFVPGASDNKRLETYPAWSPDGRSLYYCSAPIPWTDGKGEPYERYAQIRYDLRRIAYDAEQNRWGAPETVLAAEKTGQSILLPRISPDGKFLLMCQCRYGCFPVYQPSSDLYMLDLATGACAKAAEVNSEFSESWHSWSSNSRWIAYSSKRGGGMFTRCYLSYVDASGRTHKPFVVPQRDPKYYHALPKSICVPELITGPAPVGATTLARTALDGPATPIDAPPTAGTVDPGDTRAMNDTEER